MGTGCRNIQPHGPLFIEKWSMEKTDLKVKRRDGFEQNTLKYTREELSKIWRKIHIYCS